MEKIKKSLLLFLVLALSIFLLAGCGDDDDSSSSSSKKKKNNNTDDNTTSSSITSKESALDKVETETLGITENGTYIIKLKNTNNKDVYIEYVTVNFFDANGSFAESFYANNSYFCIPANKEFITYLYPTTSTTDYSKFAKSEIELSTGEPFYEYRTNVDATFNNTGSQIAATITNNTDIDLDYVDVNVAFYKNGKVVAVSNGSNFGKKVEKNGGKAYINVSYAYDKNYKTVEFDNYEGYVVSAYSRNN